MHVIPGRPCAPKPQSSRLSFSPRPAEPVERSAQPGPGTPLLGPPVCSISFRKAAAKPAVRRPPGAQGGDRLWAWEEETGWERRERSD